MLEYRDESRRLDQCQRLYDSAALHKGFELESVRISQVRSSVIITRNPNFAFVGAHASEFWKKTHKPRKRFIPKKPQSVLFLLSKVTS